MIIFSSKFKNCTRPSLTETTETLKQHIPAMKKIILLLFTGLFIIASTIAQKPYAIMNRTDMPPTIDGVIDGVWATTDEYNIAVPFRTETPTLGNPEETVWRALWNDDGIFVLIKVTDDVWSPAYAGTSPNDSLFYDHPEIYFDCNYILNDGKGTNPDGNGNGNGHHLFSLSPIKGKVNGGLISESNGAEYSYKVTETGYWVECSIPYSRLSDWEGVSLDKVEKIGFDITIIDNDSEIPLPNKMCWSNAGAIDDNRNNMDDAGILQIASESYHMPYVDKITLNQDSISTDKGTLQMNPIIEPKSAYNQKLKWVVINKTGMATIDSNGLVTAVSNGIVEVRATATDGGWAEASVEIVITGQIIDQIEIWTNNNPLTIYPNPTSGKVKLKFDQLPQSGIYFTVFDLTGKTILKQLIQEEEQWIDLKGNSSGIYFIKTNQGNQTTKKLILK